MKIRIRDNSVRLRLTQGEVEQLHTTGAVRSKTGFPGGREFAYGVECSPANVNSAAFYSENAIVVRLPEAQVAAWASTEQISIVSDQLLDDGELLRVSVEKDFACLTPRDGEDESDNYPHPEVDTASC